MIVGRSNLVGRPVAQLLLRARLHRDDHPFAHPRSSPAVRRQADILVVAIGKTEFVKGDWIKPGAAVIDVGINRIPTTEGKSRLVGDVAFAEVQKVDGLCLSPVPGGVGPMTVACLMFNTLQATRHKADWRWWRFSSVILRGGRASCAHESGRARRCRARAAIPAAIPATVPNGSASTTRPINVVDRPAAFPEG